jgi:molecular chaperone GrpE
VELAKEAADLKDRLLRTLAEMGTCAGAPSARSPTRAPMASPALRAIFWRSPDTWKRALKALDDEIREKAEAGVKALLDGVELTERELVKVMEKHGVKKLEPQGQKFDPNLHQAMFEIPDQSVLPAGTVVQVMQPGYTIGERVLRPALVGVSEGRPKAPPARRPCERQTASSLSARLDAVADLAQARENVVPGVFARSRTSADSVLPKRSHCTVVTSVPDFASLASATISLPAPAHAQRFGARDLDLLEARRAVRNTRRANVALSGLAAARARRDQQNAARPQPPRLRSVGEIATPSRAERTTRNLARLPIL